MREACIILPNAWDRGTVSPRGNEQTERDRGAHCALALELVETFGGVTVSDAQGYWLSPTRQGIGYPSRLDVEPVKVYTFAVDESATYKTPAGAVPAYHVLCSGETKVERLAEKYGRLLGQEAVYYRYPNGDVRILSLA